MVRRPLVCAGAVAGAVATVLAAAPLAAAATVSLWHMNETAGTTMVDSVGGHNGTAQHVALGQPGFQGTAYGFPGRPAIVTIPSSPDLNPGGGTFRATGHIRTSTVTTDDSADVMRKGVSTSSATFWKMELRPNSTHTSERVRCYFRGTSGVISVFGSTNNIADGAWHTITCAKTASSVSITQDGVTHAKAGAVGFVSNGTRMTIGAKSTTDDAYQGLIDEVSVGH
jgi:Concanavalin A-like lectin/glucanases superfamily